MSNHNGVDMKILSRTEELILLAVWKLHGQAYGVTIRKHLQETADLNFSIGGIYVPLDRLVRKGYLVTRQGDPTPQRGGMSKRFYELTAEGMEALQEVKRVNDLMWKNLPDVSFSS